MISLELLIDPVHSCTASKQINRKLNGLKRQAFVISQFLRLGSGHSLAGRFWFSLSQAVVKVPVKAAVISRVGWGKIHFPAPSRHRWQDSASLDHWTEALSSSLPPSGFRQILATWASAWPARSAVAGLPLQRPHQRAEDGEQGGSHSVISEVAFRYFRAFCLLRAYIQGENGHQEAEVIESHLTGSQWLLMDIRHFFCCSYLTLTLPFILFLHSYFPILPSTDTVIYLIYVLGCVCILWKRVFYISHI